MNEENEILFKNSFNISIDELNNFKKEGFLIFENVINVNKQNQLKKTIDELNKNDVKIKDPILIDDLSKIVIDEKLNHVIRKIMDDSNYHFHHLHAACHKPGMPSLGWHHDYEQYDERDNKKIMVHVFLYINGLNGEIGDLLLIPSSHTKKLKRYEYSSKPLDCFENCKIVNNIPEGSVIIINSKLIHARKAKSGGELSSRYFIDLSFCQSGVKWPPYRESNDSKNILPFLKEKYSNNKMSEFLFDHLAFELSLKDKIIEKFKLNKIKNLISKYILKNGKNNQLIN